MGLYPSALCFLLFSPWMKPVCLASYLHNHLCDLFLQILPLIQKYKVLQFNRTDARLANNGQPLELQKLRCRVNFSALRFTSQIEELGRRVIKLLRQNGPFLVLHLRYEMDMLAFSGCTQGCSPEEAEELTRMRYIKQTFSKLSQQVSIGKILNLLCICTL